MEIIRAAAAPKQKAQEAVKPVVRRKPGLIVRGTGKPTSYGIGPAVRGPDRVVNWVAKPDGEQNPGLKTGRRHGAHWLTRVAEGWRKR